MLSGELEACAAIVKVGSSVEVQQMQRLTYSAKAHISLWLRAVEKRRTGWHLKFWSNAIHHTLLLEVFPLCVSLLTANNDVRQLIVKCISQKKRRDHNTYELHSIFHFQVISYFIENGKHIANALEET